MLCLATASYCAVKLLEISVMHTRNKSLIFFMVFILLICVQNCVVVSTRNNGNLQIVKVFLRLFRNLLEYFEKFITQ